MKNKSALTLIELLITIVLISILLVPISTLYRTVFNVFYFQWARSGLKAQAGRQVAALSSDLRQATAITSAQLSSISFTADLNSDGVLETVSYPNLNFSYYGDNNTLLEFPVNISLIKVVGVNTTAVDGQESFFLTSKARVRN